MSRRLLHLLALVAGLGALSSPLAAQTPAYRDEALSFDARAADLVRRMTLAEKVSQMKDVAPAVDRLGIPAYNWWNEALHGVARSGLATVFPQAIGMAATWDTALMHQAATVISDEGRAKYHEYLRHDSHGRYQGLTFWSPNINLFRDPRWGRGQETYGEDPFLTGRLAVAFIRGLQGDDPRYLKTVATVKHFAVHSGPEPERHQFDAIVSERDLRESYLPQFEAGIREAKAYSLMCAYNRVAGRPACASQPLLKDILRGEWRFPGFIVSDCGAIDDIYLHHKVVATAPEAAAIAVKTGTDLDCGRVYPNLVEAVNRGLITEAQIDTSLKRLFLGRFRLGMFDDSAHVPWAGTKLTVLDSPEHRALARRAARESIVLLRNAGGTLPLSKTLGTIAVIGPNADEPRMLLGNYNGEPADPITPLRGIREAVSPDTRVIYARGADLADGFPMTEGVPSTMLHAPDGRPGLTVEYFAGRTMDGPPLFVAIDSTVRADWQDGSPRADLGADSFSVRWTGTVVPPRAGRYRFGLSGTMKYRLFLDDSLVARSVYPSRDDEYPDPRVAMSTPLTLDNGAHRIRVEGTETYGDAQLQLLWSPPADSLEDEAVQAARQADAVILALGLTARLEGEEMPVSLAGFRGGDRTTLDLPASQQRLMERVVALGKPTVLVLLNGSALSVGWAKEHVPAIVEAWYPGQAGGAALADVLFGDYNPGGRLPVTFYEKVSDLPPFESYDMAGRTYRYFKGQPLYPFGHGLSFTTFRYSPLRTSRDVIRDGDTISVRVGVTNTGRRRGDEVVQLYVRHPASRVARPIRELHGFTRVTLAPGEHRTVTLRLPSSALRYWDDKRHVWTLEPETVVLEAGSSSADIRSSRPLMVAGAR
jgi:beta-glucosidase